MCQSHFFLVTLAPSLFLSQNQSFLTLDPSPPGRSGWPHEYVYFFQRILRGHRTCPRKHQRRAGCKSLFWFRHPHFREKALPWKYLLLSSSNSFALGYSVKVLIFKFSEWHSTILNELFLTRKYFLALWEAFKTTAWAWQDLSFKKNGKVLKSSLRTSLWSELF